MLEAIIAEMGSLFREGVFVEKSSFRFTLDGTAITVTIDAQSYTAEKDAAVETVDCSCRASAEMFGKIWYEGYRPGIMDFLGGAIKCDAPLMLPKFLQAFGK